MQIEIWYCTFFFKACDIFCRIKHKKPQKTPSKKKKRESNKNFYTHFIVQYTICWSFNGSLDLWRKKNLQISRLFRSKHKFQLEYILIFYRILRLGTPNISNTACKTALKTYSSNRHI